MLSPDRKQLRPCFSSAGRLHMEQVTDALVSRVRKWQLLVPCFSFSLGPGSVATDFSQVCLLWVKARMCSVKRAAQPDSPSPGEAVSCLEFCQGQALPNDNT